MTPWYRSASGLERKTFWVCFSGWALDALDGQMFSLAIPALAAAFALNRGQAGAIGSVTLVSSAIGGWVAGSLSDRWGRVRTLQLTVVWFSLFTLLCAFAQTYPQILVLKSLQGLGFGGEWAAGAVLMAEAVSAAHRGKAMALVQSAWAVGWGAAVVLYSLLFSYWPAATAWRVMFAIGVLPALLVLYVQRALPHRAPAAKVAATAKSSGWLYGIFAPKVLRATSVGALLGIGAHGGYYAIMTWLPTFLKTERHLSVLGTSSYLTVIIVAFWFGCVASSALLDRWGRRPTIAVFAVCSVFTVLFYLLVPLTNHEMLALGFPLGFFAAGIPASMGPLFNELYPTGIRGTGVGFCYNFGRIVSAVFPWLVGQMSQTMPLSRAIGIDAAAAYSLVVVAVCLLPETRGKELEPEDPSERVAAPAAFPKVAPSAP